MIERIIIRHFIDTVEGENNFHIEYNGHVANFLIASNWNFLHVLTITHKFLRTLIVKTSDEMNIVLVVVRCFVKSSILTVPTDQLVVNFDEKIVFKFVLLN